GRQRRVGWEGSSIVEAVITASQFVHHMVVDDMSPRHRQKLPVLVVRLPESWESGSGERYCGAEREPFDEPRTPQGVLGVKRLIDPNQVLVVGSRLNAIEAVLICSNVGC